MAGNTHYYGEKSEKEETYEFLTQQHSSQPQEAHHMALCCWVIK